MREIRAEDITKAVSGLFQKACYHLPGDVVAALEKARSMEESSVAQNVLTKILDNAEIASGGETPLCQDTGMAVVFLELGQEVRVTGGDLYTAIEEGVRQGYGEGYLRKSVVDVQFPFGGRQVFFGFFDGKFIGLQLGGGNISASMQSPAVFQVSNRALQILFGYEQLGGNDVTFLLEQTLRIFS